MLLADASTKGLAIPTLPYYTAPGQSVKSFEQKRFAKHISAAERQSEQRPAKRRVPRPLGSHRRAGMGGEPGDLQPGWTPPDQSPQLRDPLDASQTAHGCHFSRGMGRLQVPSRQCQSGRSWRTGTTPRKSDPCRSFRILRRCPRNTAPWCALPGSRARHRRPGAASTPGICVTIINSGTNSGPKPCTACIPHWFMSARSLATV
jgi:hypothetical protein